MLFNAKLSKQLDDFSISLAIKARVIFEVTGQSALRNVHGARRIGASLDQGPDDPLVAVDDSGGERCAPVILIALLQICAVVQEPFK